VNRFLKWVGKNRVLAQILLSVFLVVVMTLLIRNVFHLLLTVFCALFCSYVLVESALLYRMNKALIQLREGNPAPMLEAGEALLECRLSAPNRLVAVLNYCVALREHHRYEEALEMLLALDVEKAPNGVNPINKFVYYNNLADLYQLLGEESSQEIYAEKAIRIYNELLSGRIKKLYEKDFHCMTAVQLYYKGEYAQALEYLLPLSNVLPTAMEGALWVAKILIAQGKTEKAKEYLHYVIENGKQLDAVRRARELLSSLEQK